ncbi:retinol dehydrogenase 11-like [Schistocerca gregaria]|uniref:retinol dehydrogenase 11-like n=1 Tax=Schistocerca gregaria TaxID=7010 RepID=UPI00211E9B68|nr:retinol dehydrogenase 11-like [Schistocerca gregaria]
MPVSLYVILPVILALTLIRGYREIKWGRCKSKSSLHGRVFIITGANSGIGKVTARELARRKATVIMACRNIKSAREAIEEIRQSVTTGDLIPLQLDLSSLASVRNFASVIIKDFPKIHVLINNAGVFIPIEENRTTEDGFEIHFGVNHLGHFLLTNLLLKKLMESAPSRIVIVSSTLHEKGNIELDNLDGKKWSRGKSRMNPGYNNSKLANVLFCTELAEKLKGTGVNVYTLCPGLVYTGLFRSTPIKWFHYILFAPVAFFFMRTPTKGAQTILHCATSEELENESGLMYRDCKLYRSKKSVEPSVSKKLWEVSEQLVGLKTD